MPWKTTLARVYSLLRNRPEGYFDALENHVVKGWAFDPASPSRTVDVSLVIDGAVIGSYAANRFRADLSQSGRGNGHHAFEIPIPPAAIDGRPHEVSLRFAGTNTVLRGSPRQLQSGAVHAGERPGAIRGAAYGGSAPPTLDPLRDDPRFKQAALQPLSVVIPTYNRGAVMEESLRAAIAHAAGLEVEFIVVDDGSSDDTQRRLATLKREFAHVRTERLANGGPGRARNAGASIARHDLVLFLGDDTRPACSDFFLHHIRAHQWMPKPEIAILGKIVWPNQRDENISFVMSHVQGAGQEQFGFFSLMPYTWLDWRFFYTANVSFKKSVAPDWSKDGFSTEFPLASFEDGEFAYRVNQRLGGQFRMLYTPAAVVTHHHPYSVRQFLDRQISAGLMARVFARLHPEATVELGIANIDAALAAPGGENQDQVEEFLSILEGVKSWAKVLDRHYNLGSQNWHGDFLRAVFEMSYLQGCVMGCTRPGANYAAAYRYVLEKFQERMATTASFEAFGRLLQIPVV